MLTKSCARNYTSLDGLVNGIDGTFQYYIKNHSKTLIWINFHNPQIGIDSKIEHSHT
jgi:hypothetical protein